MRDAQSFTIIYLATEEASPGEGLKYVGIADELMVVRKLLKVTRNHQTTVPKEARQKFRIRVGSVLEVVTTDEGILYRPIKSLEDQAGSLSKYAAVKRVKASLDRSREVEH